MALFGTDTKKKETKKEAPARKSGASKASPRGMEHVTLIAPWFSEKALIGTEKGVYVFAIPKAATKPDVAAAIERVYKVTPRQIRIANLPGKRVSLRGRRGTGIRARRRKAYVYLKKGETINLA